MIEINLLPGSVKRTKRRTGGLSAAAIPKLKLPPMDKYIMAAIGMWVVAILLIVWMQFSSASKLEAATNENLRLVRDTARLSKEIALGRELAGKRDTIADKLKLIQELDAGRFDLAHIMDEISRNVPDYTWLTSITPADGGTPNAPSFRIVGRMGNAFALPKFITDLENSPFITNVKLKDSGPVVENQKPMYMFIVEGTYEQPSADLIQTVPLFGPDMQLDSTITSAVQGPPGVNTDPASAAAAANAAAAKAAAGKPAAGKNAPVKTPPAKTPAGAKPAPGKTAPPPVKKSGK